MRHKVSTSSYYSPQELNSFGFRSVGHNVLVSSKSSIYDAHLIELGNNVRIDDYCCISGNIVLGNHCHVTPFCLLAGGEKGLLVGNYCTFAYRVSVFTQSDDYFGNSMVNSTIPKKFKNEIKKNIFIEDHVIIGANSVVLPGCSLAVGTSVGACSLVTKSTDAWGIYYGSPARRRGERSKKILKITSQFEQMI